MTTTIVLPSSPAAPCEPISEAPKMILPATMDNSAAIRLLDEWMADESGYDERVWPHVKELIEENRLSDRKRFIKRTMP